VGTLKTALQNYGDAPCEQPKVALIALTVRNKDTFEQFLHHTQEAALLLEDIELGFPATSFSRQWKIWNLVEMLKYSALHMYNLMLMSNSRYLYIVRKLKAKRRKQHIQSRRIPFSI